LSNPPYVTAEAMAALPMEYRHEPTLALAAGEDGLDIVRRLLAEAADHLNTGGFIAIEVGHNREQVDMAFPGLAAIWLDTASSEEKIFLVGDEALRDYARTH
jgi:ribosomal protein L3 glutamine methyltransferase